MFPKLKRYFINRTFDRHRDLYQRKRKEVMDNVQDPHAAGSVNGLSANADAIFQRMRLLGDFSEQITFTRFTSAIGEATSYRGLYSKAGALIQDLDRAWSVMYVNRSAEITEVKPDTGREFTLDYFLTNEENRVLKIQHVYSLLRGILEKVDNLLADISTHDTLRYQDYMYRYGFMFEDAINALEALVQVSDLNVPPK